MKQGTWQRISEIICAGSGISSGFISGIYQSPFSGAGDRNGDVPVPEGRGSALGYRLEREYRTGDVIVYEPAGRYISEE